MSVSQVFEIVIDPSLVSEGRLQALLDKLKDFQPVLSLIGTVLEGALLENFETHGLGSWDPLAESTVKERFRKGYGPNAELVRSGDLLAALTEHGAVGHRFVVSENSIIVGAYGDALPYLHALAEGNARRHLPARILAQMTPGAQDEILRILSEWLGGPSHDLTGVTILADVPISA